MTADEVEQRQPLSRSPEEPRAADHTTARPANADMYEQRQDPDGVVDPEGFDEAEGEPLTADMIEQRRAVEDDDADHPEDRRSE